MLGWGVIFLPWAIFPSCIFWHLAWLIVLSFFLCKISSSLSVSSHQHLNMYPSFKNTLLWSHVSLPDYCPISILMFIGKLLLKHFSYFLINIHSSTSHSLVSAHPTNHHHETVLTNYFFVAKANDNFQTFNYVTFQQHLTLLITSFSTFSSLVFHNNTQSWIFLYFVGISSWSLC